MKEVLSSTRDFRTPEQCAQRLGVSLRQLSDMVNLKEIGNMSVDICCSCGVYVFGDQPAVACEHCVVRLWVWVWVGRVCVCSNMFMPHQCTIAPTYCIVL
jgi:hypothetical protein